MRRSITGEREATFSILNLVETVVGLSGNVETRPLRIEEILLCRSDVRKLFDAANDADPATMKAIADHLTSLLSGYRSITTPLDFTDFPTSDYTEPLPSAHSEQLREHPTPVWKFLRGPIHKDHQPGDSRGTA